MMDDRGDLVVAFGDGDGGFSPGVVFAVRGDGLIALEHDDGAVGLAAWDGEELCFLDLSGKALSVTACVDLPNVADVVAFQGDDDAATELLVIPGSTPDPLRIVDTTAGLPEIRESAASWSANLFMDTAVADFDADGHDEVLLVGLAGDCALNACVDVTAWFDIDMPDDVTSVQGIPTRQAVTGRFDDDGIVDLFVGSYFFTGLGTELPTEGLHAIAEYEIVGFAAAGNFDGDARDEVAMGGGSSPSLTIVDAPVTLGQVDATVVPGATGEHLCVGDLDGDGFDEVVSLEAVDAPSGWGSLAVQVTRFTPTSSSTVAAELCPNCETGYGGQITALRDLDGDGALDLAALVRRPE